MLGNMFRPCHFILGKKIGKEEHYHKWPYTSTYVSGKEALTPEKSHRMERTTIHGDHHQHFGHSVNQFKKIHILSLCSLALKVIQERQINLCLQQLIPGGTQPPLNVSNYLKMHMLITLYLPRMTYT